MPITRSGLVTVTGPGWIPAIRPGLIAVALSGLVTIARSGIRSSAWRSDCLVIPSLYRCRCGRSLRSRVAYGYRPYHVADFLCGGCVSACVLESGAKIVFCLTNVQNVPAPAGVQVKWRIARWAVLPVHLTDELIEAGLMGNMRARKLQYSLASKSVLEWLFADGALAADEGPLPAVAPPVGVHDACKCCS